MPQPPAEVDVDADLVRLLLADQHPDLAGAPVTLAGDGWDNTIWRLGTDLAVRLPRRELGAQLIRREQRWLPSVAPGLPLPVPVPVHVGASGRGYPWPWSVVRWVPGAPGNLASITEPVDAGRRLGEFLRAMHQPAPPDAPHNPYRSVPLAERAPIFEGRSAGLAAETDLPAVRDVFGRALAAPPWPGPPTWLHADLHWANVLVDGGTLVGVIDFGDMCAGDPATDLCSLVMLLPEAGWPACLAAYGPVDPDTWCRALGWAVLQSTLLLDAGLVNQPTYAEPARRALDRAVRAGGSPPS